MSRKINWRKLKFIPLGGDDSQAIILGHKDYLNLCDLLRSGLLSGYSVSDLSFKPGHGGKNVQLDWRGLDNDLKSVARPSYPSVFRGKWPNTSDAQAVRKRLLEAVLMEYEAPETFVMDLRGWLDKGSAEDLRQFIHELFRHTADPRWTRALRTEDQFSFNNTTLGSTVEIRGKRTTVKNHVVDSLCETFRDHPTILANLFIVRPGN